MKSKTSNTHTSNSNSNSSKPFWSESREGRFFPNSKGKEQAFFASSIIQPKSNNNKITSQPAQSNTVASSNLGDHLQPEKKENRTGMPTSLKAGLENISGEDLSNVKVHRNSTKPAQVQANAFTDGQDIHLASGQEHHLPHEGWHVVQQMQGRVKPTRTINGTAVNDEASLELEANEMGQKAAQNDALLNLKETNGNSAHIQHSNASKVNQRTVVQRNPAFLGLSKAAWGVAANVTSVVATVGGGAARTYIAITAGESGVASLVLPSKQISGQDKLKLEQLIRYRIINLYIDRFLSRPENKAIKDELLGMSTPESTPTTPPGSDAPSSGAETGDSESGLPSGAPTADQIDQAILENVSESVRIEIEAALETGNRKIVDKEYMWSEDNVQAEGDALRSTKDKADDVGVTGFLQFKDIETSAIKEDLKLSALAKKALGSQSLPDVEDVTVRMFIGGRVGGEIEKSTWDDLAVNVEGGAAQTSTADDGSIRLIIGTVWDWSLAGPDEKTSMKNEISIDPEGNAIFTAEYRGGEDL